MGIILIGVRYRYVNQDELKSLAVTGLEFCRNVSHVKLQNKPINKFGEAAV